MRCTYLGSHHEAIYDLTDLIDYQTVLDEIKTRYRTPHTAAPIQPLCSHMDLSCITDSLLDGTLGSYRTAIPTLSHERWS